MKTFQGFGARYPIFGHIINKYLLKISKLKSKRRVPLDTNSFNSRPSAECWANYKKRSKSERKMSKTKNDKKKRSRNYKIKKKVKEQKRNQTKRAKTKKKVKDVKRDKVQQHK